MIISSSKNPKIKHVSRLRLRKYRERTGSFLVEGAREIDQALRSSLVCQEIFFVREMLNEVSRKLIKKQQQQEITLTVFQKISVRENSDGLIGIFETPDRNLIDLTNLSVSRVMILEGVEKPGNLGALLRTADAVGIDAVFITSTPIDPYSPNSIRASLGTVFKIPVISTTNQKIRDFCYRSHLKLFLAVPTKGTSLFETKFPSHFALVLGSESQGLSSYWLSLGDSRITIPMCGTGDSLNLSVSAAILLYEAWRQMAAKKVT